VDKVEAVADDDKRKLVRQFGLFEEVFDLFWVVKIALSANALDLANLTCTGGCLDILEVNLRILAKVDDRTEIVI
jgi:hypothetical protein